MATSGRDVVGFTDIDAFDLLRRPEQLGARILAGEVFVVRGLLQAVGLMDAMCDASLSAISETVGPDAAAQVRARGFERLHDVVPMEDLVGVSRAGYSSYKRLAEEAARRTVGEVLGHRGAFYLEEQPNIRFTVPYALAATNRSELESVEWTGKITAHGPHHDTWYACPDNAINLWIAISRVVVGNGLTLFPAFHGKRLPCDERGRILRDQHFPGPVNFELAAGDAIVFDGDHLHASELNWTDETRHVASLRLTLSRPTFVSDSVSRFDYVKLLPQRPGSKLRQRGLDSLRHLRRRVSARWRYSRWGRGVGSGFVIATDDPRLFHDTSASFPAPLDVDTDALDSTAGALRAALLDSDRIRAISPELCAVATERGVTVFSRRCPHQGADMAGGYVRDGELVCPWHNLPFDRHSGASRCSAVRGLKVRHYAVQTDA